MQNWTTVNGWVHPGKFVFSLQVCFKRGEKLVGSRQLTAYLPMYIISACHASQPASQSFNVTATYVDTCTTTRYDPFFSGNGRSFFNVCYRFSYSTRSIIACTTIYFEIRACCCYCLSLYLSTANYVRMQGTCVYSNPCVICHIKQLFFVSYIF